MSTRRKKNYDVPNYDEVKYNGLLMKKEVLGRNILAKEMPQALVKIVKILTNHGISNRALDIPSQELLYAFTKYDRYILLEAEGAPEETSEEYQRYTEVCKQSKSQFKPPLVIPEQKESDIIAQDSGPLTCTICVSKRVTIVAVPCGHATICITCAKNWNKSTCCTCGADIDSFIRLYSSDVPKV